MKRKISFWQVLAVIAVVAILVVILFPVFATARVNGGPRTVCLWNLKHVGAAIQFYCEDYDERYPHRDVWVDVLDEYLKNKSVIRCTVINARKDESQYGYAFNRDLSVMKVPPKPEEVPLCFDSVNLAKNASGGLDSLPRPGRHRGRSAILYADHHVRAIETK